MAVCVGVGVRVEVGVPVWVPVLVGVGVWLGVGDGPGVAVWVEVGVFVEVGVRVAVGVGEPVGVAVAGFGVGVFGGVPTTSRLLMIVRPAFEVITNEGICSSGTNGRYWTETLTTIRSARPTSTVELHVV